MTKERPIHAEVSKLIEDGKIIPTNAWILSKIQPPEKQLKFIEQAQTMTTVQLVLEINTILLNPL